VRAGPHAKSRDNSVTIGSVLIGSVDGCTGLFNSGSTPDSASFSGIITVSPGQTITSP